MPQLTGQLLGGSVAQAWIPQSSECREPSESQEEHSTNQEDLVKLTTPTAHELAVYGKD